MANERLQEEQLRDFYKERFNKFGADIKTLDWGSKKSQDDRFHIFIAMADISGASILDVGCGFADFYAFLNNRGIEIDYTGYDITPEIIEITKKRFPSIKLHTINILEASIASESFDYVFASGLFGIKIDNSGKFMFEAIAKMYDLCRHGIAFNSLSQYATSFADDRFYASPEVVFSYCKSLCPHIVLRHDYRINDFTIYMYKNTHFDQRRSLPVFK